MINNNNSITDFDANFATDFAPNPNFNNQQTGVIARSAFYTLLPLICSFTNEIL